MVISGVVALLVVGGTLWFVLPSANATAATTDGVQWTDYSPEKLKQSLAEGRPVLVKFTAKWCANCIVLDNTVYRQPSVIAALRDRRVVAMHLDVDKSGWDLLNSLAPGAPTFNAGEHARFERTARPASPIRPRRRGAAINLYAG
jgi:thiol:disulfide interchange protein